MVKTRSFRTERMYTFVCGVFFLILILGLVWLTPTINDTQYFVIRLILSLAAAGFASFLTGAIDIQIPLIPQATIKAGGALAVFALVYSTNPALVDKLGVKIVPPIKEARITVDDFLTSMDDKNYDNAYDLLLTSTKEIVSRETNAKLAKEIFDTYGKAEKRSAPISITKPPANISGDKIAVSFIYKTKFKNLPNPAMEVINLESENREWKIAGYFINP